MLCVFVDGVLQRLEMRKTERLLKCFAPFFLDVKGGERNYWEREIESVVCVVGGTSVSINDKGRMLET